LYKNLKDFWRKRRHAPEKERKDKKNEKKKHTRAPL